MTPIRVLVIDETGEGAASVARLLEADGDIQAVTARSLNDAAIEVSKHGPDVVVLVPGTQSGALEAINQVMGRQPVPILVLADRSLSRAKALDAGAIDIMTSPKLDPEREAAIRRRVRSIRGLKVVRNGHQLRTHVRGRSAVIGIAASTGGPQAVATVLSGLQGVAARILVVQHIHPDFIAGFQAWMDRECQLPVRFAADGDVLADGHVYIAPANLHLKMAASRRIVLDREPETLHRPSADVLFTSMAEHAGRNGIGVLLTGMGEDGVEGLLAIRRAGGHTIVQDQQSSAVFGMPRAAAQAGAAEQVVPLDQIARAIIETVGAGV